MPTNLKQNRPDRLETLRDNAKFLANKYADAYLDGNEPLLKELDQAIPDVYAEAMRLLPDAVLRWKPPDGMPDFWGIDTPERAKLSPGHAERAWKEIAEEAGKALANVKPDADDEDATPDDAPGEPADDGPREPARDVIDELVEKAGKEHVNLRELAKVLDVSPRTIARWRKNTEVKKRYPELGRKIADADKVVGARIELRKALKTFRDLGYIA